jgi:hypothetical protein
MELCGADLFFEKQKITISPCMETKFSSRYASNPDAGFEPRVRIWRLRFESGVLIRIRRLGFEPGVWVRIRRFGFEFGVSPAHSDYQSPGGWPLGMALGCGLTSVRGNRGENYENEPLVRQKHIKKKNIRFKREMYGTALATLQQGKVCSSELLKQKSELIQSFPQNLVIQTALIAYFYRTLKKLKRSANLIITLYTER